MANEIVAYVGKVITGNLHELTTWHGETIGKIRLVSSWPIPRSYVSDRMYQAYAHVDGVRYTGRTAGQCMSFKGKRCAKQSFI
jgi:hypothetical protein